MVNNFYFVVIAVLFIVVIKNIFQKSNKPKAFEDEINEPLKPQTQSKNKWLYPTDEFGKMEEGTVSDSKTYKICIIKDELEEDFTIINK